MCLKTLVTAILLAAGLTATASAAPITYTLTGEADVLVRATGLLDAPIVWTFKGDTDELFWLGPGSYIQPFQSNALYIPGFGTITPTDQLGAFNNIVAPFTLFLTDGGVNGGIAVEAPELYTYDGLFSLGPITVFYDDSAPLASDHGDFTLIGGSFTLQISGVPEPATLALFGTSLIGLAFLTTRRRQARVRL